jgi:GH15 family glucan-1,4-alpha-glucosidase
MIMLPVNVARTGEHDLAETTLDHLEGYRQSKPVRIGNGAFKQQQLDVYGELMDAIYIYNRYEAISYDLWNNLRKLLEWLKNHWRDPDEGIWEVRGGPRQFVHSRLMCWVAFDRALRLVRHRGLPAPMVDWMRASAEIYEQIMENGWSEKKQSFVQYYGSEAIDASALLMVFTRFAGPTDPRMLHTIDRIQKELASDSLVYRYNPKEAAFDGLGSIEGTFSPCSFWLAESLARAGRLDEARLMLEKMLTYSNHVGLYAEEIGPTSVLLLVDQAFRSLLNRNRHGEGVSPAWHSQNMARTLRISLHLLTQVVNMRFDQAGISTFIVSPHTAAYDARCQNLSGMRHQQMEQAALGGSHFHFALISKDFMAQRIERNWPNNHHW